MLNDGWLAGVRESYDTVAGNYAERVREALAGSVYARAALGLFGELVRGAGGGPVVDAGCGPGHVTAYLDGLGVEAFGVDLSPGMVAVARRDWPGLRFEVGSMTALEAGDGSVGGVLAWWSVVHVPDEVVPAVFREFRRVLRVGAPVAVGFHVGDLVRAKTEGYGGLPMNVDVYRRPPERVAGWLREAGFGVEAQLVMDPDGDAPGAVVFGRR